MKRVTCGVLIVSMVMVTCSAWADSLYRCTDGTFTNKAELQCAIYEAKGIVRVQARTAEPSNDSMKREENKTGSADVKVLKDSVK